ncbi:hypothetical protein [Clostridium chrysemydis]|uniref:hypothetical protein n=1 Tax=Clostridium chrysemydis TaxID=2665504 RepID=UPI001883A754|nr:hypothetical protein [Clostridium chrysemydis]
MKEIHYDISCKDVSMNCEMNYNTKFFKVLRCVMKFCLAILLIIALLIIMAMFITPKSMDLMLIIFSMCITIMPIIIFKASCTLKGMCSSLRVLASIKFYKRSIYYDDENIIIYTKILNFKIKNKIKIENIKEYNNLYFLKAPRNRTCMKDFNNIVLIPKTVFKNEDDENDFKRYFYLNMKDDFEKVDEDFDCSVDTSNLKKEKTYALICVFCMITYFFIITII